MESIGGVLERGYNGGGVMGVVSTYEMRSIMIMSWGHMKLTFPPDGVSPSSCGMTTPIL